jgi:hypothetical protein
MSGIKSFTLLSAILGASLSACFGFSQAQWPEYGGNPQHTAEATNGVQALNSILWQTPIDLKPPYNGTDLLIHYGCPLISGGGTVVLAVRTGPSSSFPTTNDTYQIEGHNLGTGALVYTQTTDYTDWMPHDWTPSMTPAIDSNDVLYIPGAGGTIYQRSNANSATATVTQLCFYGMGNYSANTSAYNSNVQICTPLVIDGNNNVYFGFYVASSFYSSGSNVPGLKCGIAKITSSGVGSWVNVDTITGDSGDEVQTNSEPAISNDGTHLYEATKTALWYNYGNPKLIEINTSDLSKVATVSLTIPASTPTDPSAFAYVMDDGTASPMVGPDGDVYFGVWYQNIERGFMLHYSGDLSTKKVAGAFGWDDTAAVVPASCVPSYTGSSSYLILTKYNNYADPGAYGDGNNKVAILDPNASETYTIQYGTDNPGGVMVGDNTSGATTGASYTTMNEVITLLGITPNTSEGLEGFREWCINTAAIDVLGKAAVVNSEDGHTYRWDFTTNSITQELNLEPPTGEAYTPTVASRDGIAIAVNNATVFALWDGIKPNALSLVSGTSLTGSQSTTGEIKLSGYATGPGATISLSASDGNLTVPASVTVPNGSYYVTFPVSSSTVNADDPVTITASRYGFTTQLQVTVKAAVLNTFSVAPTSVQGGVNSTGVIYLNSYAGSNGTTVTCSGSSPVTVPPTASVLAGATNATFPIQTAAVSSSTVAPVSVTLGTTTLTANLTVTPATLSSFYFTPSTVVTPSNVTAVVRLNGAAGPSGDAVTVSGSGPATLPSKITVPAGATYTSVSIPVSAVSTSTNETVTVSWSGGTLQSTFTATSPATISGLSISNHTPYMTDAVTGTVTLNKAVTANTPITLTTNNGNISIAIPAVVAAGSNQATFQADCVQLTNQQRYPTNLQASLNGSVITNSIVITPIALSQLSLSNTTIHAGQITVLTITAGQPAGVLPLKVGVGAGSAPVTVQNQATILPGNSTVQVTITAASTVTGKVTVPISCNMSNSQLSINLTVEP